MGEALGENEDEGRSQLQLLRSSCQVRHPFQSRGEEEHASTVPASNLGFQGF